MTKRHQTQTEYPRRAAAQFTDENDHNPLIQEDCPRCRGSGKFCRRTTENGAEVLTLEKCSACHGAGVTGNVVPFFANENSEMEAPIRDRGTTCPNCGWRFRLYDPNAWTGRRHRKCGQKIKLVGSPDNP